MAKYQKGDKVRYMGLDVKETVCECCGHVDTEYNTIEKEGVIKRVFKDYVLAGEDFGMESKEEIRNGEKVNIPCFKPISPLKKKLLFEIKGGEVITPESIIV